MSSVRIPLEAKLAKRDRRTARKLPATMLLVMIVIAAVLNFLPMRTTIAVGRTVIDDILGPGSTLTLESLVGTHITLDAASTLMNTTTLNVLLRTSLNSSNSPLLAITKKVDFLALKSQSIAVDIASRTKPNGTGIILQLRVTLLSLTISGYNLGGTIKDRYNETSLSGLNPNLIVTLDRVFLDLFVDPTVTVATYLISADMTVYQGLALLVQATL